MQTYHEHGFMLAIRIALGIAFCLIFISKKLLKSAHDKHRKPTKNEKSFHHFAFFTFLGIFLFPFLGFIIAPFFIYPNFYRRIQAEWPGLIFLIGLIIVFLFVMFFLYVKDHFVSMKAADEIKTITKAERKKEFIRYLKVIAVYLLIALVIKLVFSA